MTLKTIALGRSKRLRRQVATRVLALLVLLGCTPVIINYKQNLPLDMSKDEHWKISKHSWCDMTKMDT
jgi:hypothetical protein